MVKILSRDADLCEELYRFADSFERDGNGRRTPALLRRAAKRIIELSERKRFLAQAMEARRAETGTGSVEDESAVGNADAPGGQSS